MKRSLQGFGFLAAVWGLIYFACKLLDEEATMSSSPLFALVIATSKTQKPLKNQGIPAMARAKNHS